MKNKLINQDIRIYWRHRLGFPRARKFVSFELNLIIMTYSKEINRLRSFEISKTGMTSFLCENWKSLQDIRQLKQPYNLWFKFDKIINTRRGHITYQANWKYWSPFKYLVSCAFINSLSWRRFGRKEFNEHTLFGIEVALLTYVYQGFAFAGQNLFDHSQWSKVPKMVKRGQNNSIG